MERTMEAEIAGLRQSLSHRHAEGLHLAVLEVQAMVEEPEWTDAQREALLWAATRLHGCCAQEVSARANGTSPVDVFADAEARARAEGLREAAGIARRKMYGPPVISHEAHAHNDACDDIAEACKEAAEEVLAREGDARG